jgi:Dcp1-like decapping family
MTPRKPKQRQQHHRPTPSLIQASDYESDAQTYAHIHNIPPPTRTNTELNLSVLRRYNPSILTILSIAANAVIYLFTPSTQQWEKSGVEGTLFICETQPPSTAVDAGYCVVVLNRRGLDNLILDLSRAQDVEVTAELLIIRFQEGAEGDQKVMGIWIHKDKDDTREVNAALIQQCWEKVAAAKGEYAVAGEAVGSNGNAGGTFGGGNISAGAEGPAGGRRISLMDLFGQQGS